MSSIDGFLVSIAPGVSLARSPVARIAAIFYTCWFPLLLCFPCFLIVVLGISRLGPYMQETQRKKQDWLNEYGRHILAQLTGIQERTLLSSVGVLVGAALLTGCT